MSTPTENEVLNMLAEMYDREQMQSGDILVSAFMKKVGISKSAAYRFLQQKAKEGILVRVKSRSPRGIPCIVYRAANGKTLPKQKRGRE